MKGAPRANELALALAQKWGSLVRQHAFEPDTVDRPSIKKRVEQASLFDSP